MRDVLRASGRFAVDLLYPPRCTGCGRFGQGFLCGDCIEGARRAGGPGCCANCSSPWQEQGFCPDCAHWDAVDGAEAVFVYEGAAQRAIPALKDGHTRAAAEVMGGLIAAPAMSLEPDVAFAVPLHRSRRRRRGYNQAEELLRYTGMPLGEGRLERVLKTRTQVGLALSERRRNVRGAFRYSGPELTGMNVVVVDDVITTGSTANECARVLKDFGAKSVHVAAFARANPGQAATVDA